jgi:hypothetical protein
MFYLLDAVVWKRDALKAAARSVRWMTATVMAVLPN